MKIHWSGCLALLIAAAAQAQNARVGLPVSDIPGAAAAAGAASGAALSLPASQVKVSLSGTVPVFTAPSVSPKLGLAGVVENAGRAPSPEGANIALDAAYSASHFKPGAVVTARTVAEAPPSLEAPDKGQAEPAKIAVPAPEKPESPSETAAKLVTAGAVIAGTAAAFYFLAQAFTSMVMQWEAQLRAAQDFWNMMP